MRGKTRVPGVLGKFVSFDEILELRTLILTFHRTLTGDLHQGADQARLRTWPQRRGKFLTHTVRRACENQVQGLPFHNEEAADAQAVLRKMAEDGRGRSPNYTGNGRPLSGGVTSATGPEPEGHKSAKRICSFIAKPADINRPMHKPNDPINQNSVVTASRSRSVSSNSKIDRSWRMCVSVVVPVRGTMSTWVK
jgi:hypothetical protein